MAEFTIDELRLIRAAIDCAIPEWEDAQSICMEACDPQRADQLGLRVRAAEALRDRIEAAV